MFCDNLVLPCAIREWKWYWISSNISMSEVYKYPYEPWDRRGLSLNKDISIDLVHNLVLPNATGYWDSSSVSKNISISDVYKYPYEIWNRQCLSMNKNITIDLIHNLVLGYVRDL